MGDQQRYYQTITFLSLFVGYALYAYNRKCVTYSMPALVKDGITRSDAGSIASSQNAAYMVGKLLAGILSDQISAKLLFSGGLLCSGIVTILFSRSSSVWVFVGLWFLHGLFQGCGWPAVAKLIRRWFSRANFGFYWSVLAASSNVALAFSPYLISRLIEQSGWRYSVQLSGVVCIVFAIAASLLLIDQPASVGLESYADDQQAKSKVPAKTAAKAGSKSAGKSTEEKVTMSQLIRRPFIWIISLAYFAVFLAKSCTGDWSGFYLQEELSFSSFDASTFVGSMETGGFIGSILVGVLADYVAAGQPKGGSMFANRKYLLSAGFTGLCAGCACILTRPELFHLGMATTLFHAVAFASGFCLYAPIQLFGVLASEAAPDYLSGSSHAFVAAFASFGAIVSGWPALKLAAVYSFRTLFTLLFQLLLLCFLLMGTMRLFFAHPTTSAGSKAADSSKPARTTKPAKPTRQARRA